MECGTRLIFGAALDGYRGSEIALAKTLASRLRAGMLCLADRLFFWLRALAAVRRHKGAPALACKRNGTVTLRSKKPELVKQEFWGMILAHYLVRKMMAQAALDRKCEPDELSYKGSIEIIKSMQTGPVLKISP